MKRTNDVRIAAAVAIVAAALAAMACPPDARAEGALAVAYTGDAVRDGFAYGYSIGKDGHRTAGEKALGACQRRQNAKRIAARRRVIATFKRQCFAVAMDPADRTAGVGWAIGPSKAAAERLALATCRATAGAGRAPFCRTDNSGCDRGG